MSHVIYPHLHLTRRIKPISLGDDLEPLAVAKIHIPTGMISIEDLVRLLITELDVEPRRPDWNALLAESQAARKRDQPW